MLNLKRMLLSEMSPLTSLVVSQLGPVPGKVDELKLAMGSSNKTTRILKNPSKADHKELTILSRFLGVSAKELITVYGVGEIGLHPWEKELYIPITPIETG